ncbi:radical SAM protein [Sphingorhabdus sp. Alg239-R122]|uniref:radical SAM protein n=1 Tax=Sphingorhabdus sp. Alg239-R122 TaxID=2305989 RepID=UPI0013DA419D|nr:radical SAM protein [Sphingorhabdus sp. Alg239-R122]
MKIRSQPGAGISIGLTRKCPLSCAHCSTNSSLQSEEYPEDRFVRFVGTFSPQHHPEIMALSGGEALLRPKLIMKLAKMARRAGTSSSVLSGLFFARHPTIPANIERAIRSVDHFSVSTDAYHEQEIHRDLVLKTLDTVLSYGTDVSVHLVGANEDDPFIADATADIQQRFGDDVPILVNLLEPFGRARKWFSKAVPEEQEQIKASPCHMAAWPVMSYDGTIVACGNDDVIEKLPDHLVLGHAMTDSWQTISERSASSCTLRAIRLYGPEFTVNRFSSQKPDCTGYCDTCINMQPTRDFGKNLNKHMTSPSIRLLEDTVAVLRLEAGAEAFARSEGTAKFSDLVSLGRDG